ATRMRVSAVLRETSARLFTMDLRLAARLADGGPCGRADRASYCNRRPGMHPGRAPNGAQPRVSARIRILALSAWAARPSPSARVAASSPSGTAAAADTPTRLVRFWKSYTPSGDEKRAVRIVGRTWLGPAQ